MAGRSRDGGGSARRANRPPKLDKETRRRASDRLWGDPSFVMANLARLVVFIAAAWPTLDQFSRGTIEPLAAAVRLLGAALFALVGVALVSWLVSGYRDGPGDRR